MRLIDADKLLSDYSYLFMDIYGKECARMFVGIVNQAQTIDAVGELEKVKTEFLDKCKNYYRFDNEIILDSFAELIDNHVSELKGE